MAYTGKPKRDLNLEILANQPTSPAKRLKTNSELSIDDIFEQVLSTPGDHCKAGCFKRSQFWLNEIEKQLSPEQMKALTQFALVSRFRRVKEYDNVTRNPGVFANDCLNRFLQSKTFPSQKFYEWMKDPDNHAEQIKDYINNIPDDIIELYVPFYHACLNEPGNFMALEKDLQDKQFLGLALFGAMTWRANEFEADVQEAQRIKKNIINFKKREDRPFDSIMERIKQKQGALAQQDFDQSNFITLDSDTEAVLRNILADKKHRSNYQKIQAYNDAFYDVLNALRSTYSNAGNEYNNQQKLLLSLSSQIDRERQTGKPISKQLEDDILHFIKENIPDMISEPKLFKAHDAVSEFSQTKAVLNRIEESKLLELLAPTDNIVEANNEILALLDSRIKQHEGRLNNMQKTSPRNLIAKITGTSKSHKEDKLKALHHIHNKLREMAETGKLIDFESAYAICKKDPSMKQDMLILEDSSAKGTKHFLEHELSDLVTRQRNSIIVTKADNASLIRKTK